MRIYLTFLLLISVLFSFAQPREITGRVTDRNGESLPGVSVSLNESAVATSTDANGSFKITVPEDTKSLIFRLIGFTTQEVSIGQGNQVNVTLVEDFQKLDEVVIVGYGSMRKRDMTGSVASIKSESLENRVIQSLDDALAGEVAGLMVQSGGGQPGAASNILIRGANSLTGSTQPLIVVDGFPLFETSTSTGGGMTDKSGDLSTLSFINPNDIASIEVLKDASATAIYGNRGSNGVILITTKKGKGSGSKIQYNNYFSTQMLPKKYDVFDFTGYAAYQAANSPTNSLFVDQSTGLGFEFDPNVRSVDWQDEIYRTGFLQNHSLSIQNSGEKTNFMASGSYMQNKSIIRNTNWKKLNGRLSADHSFTDKIKVGADVAFSQVSDDGVPTGGGDGTALGVVIGAILARPFVFDETTQAYFRRAGVRQGTITSDLAGYRDDPLNLVNAVDLLKTIRKTTLNTYLQYDILDQLQLRITAGYDVNGLEDKQFYPTSTPTGNFYNGLGILGSINSRSWINENTLTWTPQFEGGHQLNILAGITEQGFTSDFSRSEFSSFENESLGYNNAQMAKNFNTYSNTGQTNFMSFIGRVNYSYNSKYLMTFTVRRDGTSAFKNNKWSTFYSGAVAYNLAEEDFIKDSDYISNLKFRLSLGEVGNSNVPTTGAYAQLYNTNYNFNNSIAIGQSAASLANENLRWERTREWNLGAEIGLFDGKIALTADYYIKDTRDLLLEAPILNISGFDKAWQNIGMLRNEGIELNLHTQLLNRNDFTWDFNLNFAKNNSTIKELGQNGAPIYLAANFLSSSAGQQAVILKEGGSIGSLHGYVADGVYGLDDFNADGSPKPGVAVEGVGEKAGWIRYKDLNDDGKITSEDRTTIGKTLPDFFGAFSSSLTWKNIDLQLAFQYSYGNDVFNANYIQAARFGSVQYNQMSFYEDRWTPENPESSQYAQLAVGTISSVYVEDGSFLRLKTARLGYTFRGAWLENLKGIKNLKVYIAADNLLTFTGYSGYDPEITGSQGAGNMTSVLTSGFDYGVFPRAKTFTAGLNVVF